MYSAAASLLICILAAIFIIYRSVEAPSSTQPAKLQKQRHKTHDATKAQQSAKLVKEEALELKNKLQKLIRIQGRDGNEEAVIHQFCQTLTLETLPYFLQMLKIFDENVDGYYTLAKINYSIHARWIELDSKAALASARANWERMPEGSFLTLLSFWGESQPDAALNFYFELKADPTASFDELLSLLKSTAITNLGVSAKELSSLPESQEKQLTIQKLLSKIVLDTKLPSEEVKKWVSTFNDPDLSNLYTLLSLEQLARDSPKEAFISAESLKIDPELRKVHLTSFFHEWSLQEPQAALDWLTDAEHLSIEERGKYYSILVKGWSNSNLEETILWLEKTTNNGEYDEAISEIILKIKNTDESKAREWIEKIINPTLRKDALNNLERKESDEIN